MCFFRFSFLTRENISEERLSPKSGSGFISLFAYNDSKLCNVLFSNELNRRLSKHKVYCNAVHPGNVVSSYLARNWWFYRLIYAIVRPFTKSLVSIIVYLEYCFVKLWAYVLSVLLNDNIKVKLRMIYIMFPTAKKKDRALQMYERGNFQWKRTF